MSRSSEQYIRAAIFQLKLGLLNVTMLDKTKIVKEPKEIEKLKPYPLKRVKGYIRLPITGRISIAEQPSPSGK